MSFVYKCVAKSGCTLSPVQAFPFDPVLMPDVVGGNKRLYLHSWRVLYIIDSDTMTLLSFVLLQHEVLDMAVSEDDKLHIATRNGVHIYTTDGAYTVVILVSHI